PPQTSQEITLSFDADGLVPGTYQGRLRLSSNDPLAPEITIPLTLTVVGGGQISAGTFHVHPNQAFDVPIRLVGRALPETFTFTLTFAPHLLEFLDVHTGGTLAENALLDIDASTPGQIHVTTRAPFTATGDLDPERPLMVVSFRAREALGDTELAFADVGINDGQLPVDIVPGFVSVTPLFGDATLDLLITQRDVAAAGRHAIGTTPLSPTAQVAADVSGDGTITLIDAALIKQFVKGTIDCFPVEAGCGGASKHGGPATADLHWGTPLPSSNAASFDVPLLIEHIEGPVLAVHLRATFDPGTVSLEGATAIGLPEDWEILYSGTEDRFEAAFWGSTPLSEGHMANLRLRLQTPDDAPALPAWARINEGPMRALGITPAMDVPERFELGPNYPNPFNPTTTITYALPEPVRVQLILYNLLGQPVRTLVDREQQAGRYTVAWDGRDDTRRLVASGTYYYQLRAGSFVATRPMTLLK
ncbi:MAG: FlgD immunoglobulin-like domain containing protein, partial [Rhodothermales bacterium]